MSVAFRASAAAGNGQSAIVSSLNITIPTSGTGGAVAVGDDAVLLVTTSNHTATLTIPAGWTVLSGPDRVGSKGPTAWLLRKTLAAGDLASTVTLAISPATRLVASLVIGTGTTTTGLLSGALVQTSPTATPGLPTLKAVPSGSLVVAMFGRSVNGTPSATVSPPAGFTTGSQAGTAYGTSAEMTAFGSWSTTAAGTVTGTGTSSPSSAGLGYLVALPAVGTPTPPPPPPSQVPIVSSVWPPDPYRAVIRSGGYALTYTADASLGGAAIDGAQGMAPIGGTLTDTTKPGVRRTLALDLAAEPGLFDLLAPVGTTLTVTAHVKYLSQATLDIPMGVFDVDTESLAEGGGKLSLTAPDKWVRIQRAQFLGPATSTRGIAVTAQIVALIRGALGASEPVTVTATSTATMGVQTWDKDRAQTIIDLATTIGAWVFFDRYGVATIADVPTIGPTADWLVDASPSGVLLSLDRSRSRASTYNVVAVSSSASAGPAFTTQWVWDNDPNSPTFAGPGTGSGTTPPVTGSGGPFGQVPYFFDSPILTTSGAAIAAGKTILARTTGLAMQVSGSVAPNPAMDAFDSLDVLPPKERYDIPRVVERHFADTVTHGLAVDVALHIDGRSTRTDVYAG